MQQVRVAREFGIPRILLANQLIGPSSIAYIAEELAADPAFEFHCLVDSVAGVDLLVESLRRHNATRPLNVLVEVGIAGKRCGCRGVEAAMTVARRRERRGAMARAAGRRGIRGVITGATPADRDEQVRRFLAEMVDVAVVAAERLFAASPVLITAGGSCFFDLVTEGLRDIGVPEVELLVRSGCDPRRMTRWCCSGTSSSYLERSAAARGTRRRFCGRRLEVLVVRADASRADSSGVVDGQTRRVVRRRFAVAFVVVSTGPRHVARPYPARLRGGRIERPARDARLAGRLAVGGW
jgi:hypothetical protein